MQRALPRIAVPLKHIRANSTLSGLTDGMAARASKVKEAQEVFTRGGVGMGEANPTFLKGANDRQALMALCGLTGLGSLYIVTGLYQFFTGKNKKTPGQ